MDPGKPIRDRIKPNRLLESSDISGKTPVWSDTPFKDTSPVTVPADFAYDPTLAYEKNQRAPLTLRATDQETARVVAVHHGSGVIVGAGCLVDTNYVLTCRHVVTAALDRVKGTSLVGREILVSLPGVSSQPTVRATVVKIGGDGPENDLALIRFRDGSGLSLIEAVEFASPLRHGGKSYSVLGFPGGDKQGRNAMGTLHAADAKGLVQMDRGGALSVLGGFSGAPVWSSDLHAFVGLVVTELANENISWCIPSRRLCEFYPALRVRFRIPPVDRPTVHDSDVDDPNVELFGLVNDNGDRRLSAIIRERDGYFTVNVYYECKAGKPPRGHFVTFITYPDFEEDDEDAYELIAEVEPTKSGRTWSGTQEFYPNELFTVAAIGDAGDTVLTLNLDSVLVTRSGKKRATPKKGKRK